MSALHWEALRKQKVVDKRVEQELKREEDLKKLKEQNRQELLEQYNNGRYFGASANVTSYERQLTATSQSQKNSSHGDGTCPRGKNHVSMDSEKRRVHQQTAKRIQMPLRYNDTNFAQQW
ncbi:uncharacterized protein [Amphiura filiformis]|uniref:uncharacterized protein n=1 Tax=Amphiura filiformis TaxID=82378 RepID=UPI003B22526F